MKQETTTHFVPNLAFGIANLMPTPENSNEWKADFENIKNAIPSNYSDARKEFMNKEICDLMIGLATCAELFRISNKDGSKRFYPTIPKICISLYIEEPFAVACKALGWRIRLYKKRFFKLFPYKANIQTDPKRIQTQDQYKKYRQELLALQKNTALSTTEQ